jgi:hypothetical protein
MPVIRSRDSELSHLLTQSTESLAAKPNLHSAAVEAGARPQPLT